MAEIDADWNAALTKGVVVIQHKQRRRMLIEKPFFFYQKYKNIKGET